jgi:hypothetical protein
MILVDMKQGSEEWLKFRQGRISGTGLADIWAARQYTKDDIIRVLEANNIEFKKSALKGELEKLLSDKDKAVLASEAEKKLGFYQVIAERLSLDPDSEPRMDRGLRLEEEAGELFTKRTGKKLIRTGCCVSDHDPRIINSPDFLVQPPSGAAIYMEAVETKCLSPARHLQAAIENQVPDEFFTQKVQYFVVNEYLETLYFVFYDPRIATLPMHIIPVTREELGDWPAIMLQFQLDRLKEIDEIVEKLAF